MFKFKAAASAAFVASFVVPVLASAQDASTLAASTTLYGGGAGTPAIAYVGHSFLTTGSRLTSPADAGSLFGAWSAGTNKPTISYCQSGTSFGRSVLSGTKTATGACGSYSPPVASLGFSAPTADANFIAIDTPVTASDYSTFLANKPGRTEPVQFPAVISALAIVYKNADASSQISLSDSQICQIFKGSINNWSQLGLPAKPITVVYRSDAAGASFSFTNHLSAACPTATPVAVTGYSTNSTFASAVPGGVLPPGAVGQTSNTGVTSTVAATEGAIGYADAGDAIARGTVSYAKVNGKDPGLNLKKTYSISSASLLIDKAISGNDANGRPVVSSVAASVAGCLLLVDPNAYATSTTNYPIVSVGYLTGYYAGNGADVTNLKSFFKGPYTFGVKSNTTTVGVGTGFAFVAGSVATPVKQAIGACIH